MQGVSHARACVLTSVGVLVCVHVRVYTFVRVCMSECLDKEYAVEVQNTLVDVHKEHGERCNARLQTAMQVPHEIGCVMPCVHVYIHRATLQACMCAAHACSCVDALESASVSMSVCLCLHIRLHISIHEQMYSQGCAPARL